jgi:hypothetical protein
MAIRDATRLRRVFGSGLRDAELTLAEHQDGVAPDAWLRLHRLNR